MSASILDSAFRLKWCRTGLGKRDDFRARDANGFCRIYRLDGGPHDGRWFWTCARTYQIATGHSGSTREAALAAEMALHNAQ